MKTNDTGWTVTDTSMTTSNGHPYFEWSNEKFINKSLVITKYGIRDYPENINTIEFKKNEIKKLQRKLNKKNINTNDKNIILNLIRTLTNEINDEKRKQLYEKKQ